MQPGKRRFSKSRSDDRLLLCASSFGAAVTVGAHSPRSIRPRRGRRRRRRPRGHASRAGTDGRADPGWRSITLRASRRCRLAGQTPWLIYCFCSSVGARGWRNMLALGDLAQAHSCALANCCLTRPPRRVMAGMLAIPRLSGSLSD
jgi:hypothetical protein